MYLKFYMCLIFSLVNLDLTSGETSLRFGGENATSSTCKEMLISFAYMTSNFTYCAILHARPIKLCQECVTYYLGVKSVYSDLQIEDMEGGDCRDQLTNLDRLQVVGSGFDYVDQLWARASCNSCFVFEDGKPHLTNVVLKILNTSAVLDECIQTYNNLTCTKCEQDYFELNRLYNNMKAASGDINFCMDIIDLMNTTRYKWSNTYGCCSDRKKTEKTFFSIMGGILLASFLFYAMVFAFTRKTEHPIMPQKRWKEKFITKRSSITSASITTS